MPLESASGSRALIATELPLPVRRVLGVRQLVLLTAIESVRRINRLDRQLADLCIALSPAEIAALEAAQALGSEMLMEAILVIHPEPSAPARRGAVPPESEAAHG